MVICSDCELAAYLWIAGWQLDNRDNGFLPNNYMYLSGKTGKNIILNIQQTRRELKFSGARCKRIFINIGAGRLKKEDGDEDCLISFSFQIVFAVRAV